MSGDDKDIINSTDAGLPNLPDKLRKKIEEVDPEQTDEVRFTNGHRTLNSDNPVRVVEFYLETKESNWRKAAFRDKSYDLTRFLEYCESVGIDDLSELETGPPGTSRLAEACQEHQPDYAPWPVGQHPRFPSLV
jgi:hypothetical protein